MPLGSSGLTEHYTSPPFRNFQFLADLLDYLTVNGTGLGVSLGRFFQYGIIQGEVGY